MEDTQEKARQMAAALRTAIRERRTWAMPAVIVRFQDGPATEETGPYAAAPQSELALKSWPGHGRPHQVVAEFDQDELDALADYAPEDLDQYVADVLVW